MSREFVLWGWVGTWSGVKRPLPVMGGSLGDCRTRQRQFQSDYSDALSGIYPQGVVPVGLTLQVEERVKNESHETIR